MHSDPSPHAGHLCVAFDSRAELESRARDYLAAGAAAGRLVQFIAPRADAADLPFVALGDTYPEGTVIDPPAQVALYAAATERALAAGYTGLRVVADVTPLVRTPVQLDAFARYEHQADRYIRDHPFEALCAYSRTELGDDAIAQVACLHSRSEPDTPFRLCACPPADGDAALTGELDGSTDDLFTTALRQAALTPVGGEVVLQAGRLRFADHGALLRLQQYADDHATTVVLRGGGRALSRLADLLELSRVRVEAAR